MPNETPADGGFGKEMDLGTSRGVPFSVDPATVATGRTCVIGSSGSGKSYAVGVLCEELCRNDVPFAVVDTEGEYGGLKEKFEAIWVGEEAGSDLSWEGLDLDDLARQAPDISPLILDVSDLDDPKEKVSAFLSSLYSVLTERRTPYLIVLEEADKFIPQAGQRLPIFAEIARRGRKRGMGLMICTQRPSLVDKNVLSQCGNQLIGKLIIQNDLQSVAQFFPGKGIPKELTNLKAGEFFAMGGLAAQPKVVVVRRRTTRHGGITPSLAKRVVKKYQGPAAARPAPDPPKTEAPAGSPKAKQAKTAQGLLASLKAEDVPEMVRRQRRYGIFGPREAVTSVEAQFRTLVEVGVRMRRGILKKRLETVYVVLDGVTGKEVKVNRGLEGKPGFERLLGLSTLQVEVLRCVQTGSDTSALDVASTLGESTSTVSRTLGFLHDRRLVRVVEVRRKKLFRRLADLPDEPSGFEPLEVGEVDLGGASVVPPKVREDSLRDAIKGLWEGADIASFETILYPVFRVELLLRRRRRELLLDGRNGRELDF